MRVRGRGMRRFINFFLCNIEFFGSLDTPYLMLICYLFYLVFVIFFLRGKKRCLVTLCGFGKCLNILCCSSIGGMVIPSCYCLYMYSTYFYILAIAIHDVYKLIVT